MFDQTFITNGGKRRPWTYAVGLTGELLALGFLMLLPLIYTDQLGAFGSSRLPIVAPQDLPSKPPRFATPAARQTVRYVKVWNANTLYAPVRIPQTVNTQPDDFIDVPAGVFVPGGIPSSGPPGVPGGMNAINTPIPPPPERPRTPEPTAMAPDRRAPVRVSAGVQEAMIVRRVIPIYPPLARQARVSGTVRLLGIIARDGTIQHLQVISGHALLVNAAVDAVRQWVYRPTLLSGEPVEVQAPIDVKFTLSQ